MKALFVILFSISFLQGCDYNEVKSVPVSASNSLLATPEATISFELIQTQTAACLNCHSAGGRQPELTSKQALIENMADVLTEVLGDTMPPVKKGYALFTPCQKAALQKWYDLGSPDTSEVRVNSLIECAVAPVVTNPEPPPEPTTPPVVVIPDPVVIPPPVVETMIDFKYIEMKMAVCLNCHTPGKKNPNLSTKQDLIDNGSDILSEVLSDSMPPKKKFASFTPCEKAALQKWYDLGSPDESTTPVSSLPECIVSN